MNDDAKEGEKFEKRWRRGQKVVGGGTKKAYVGTGRIIYLCWNGQDYMGRIYYLGVVSMGRI